VRPTVHRLEQAGGLIAEQAFGTGVVGLDPANGAGGGGVHALQPDDAAHVTSGLAELPTAGSTAVGSIMLAPDFLHIS
jgi:hypothetical protein